MPYTLMPVPKQQILSAAGLPLVGGKIYTYAAGTNNPKDTYTDAAGVAKQANPIVLNARGEPDSPIFWNGAYKVEIRDTLNNLIYTVDNYNTDPAGVGNILTRLLASTGSALVGFIQAGASAVGRLLQDKVREQPLTPRDFGGIGDGASHQLNTVYGTLAAAQAVYPFATALTQEIDWCAIVAMFRRAKITNQECKFLAATWYVLDPLEVIGTSTAANSTERGNFKISGESMHNSVLVFNITDDTKAAMPFANGSSGWDISDFRIKNLNAYYGTGFYFDNIYTSNVRNIHAFHFNIGVEKTSYISTFTNVVAANCNCGFYDHGGTSTTNESLYAAVCTTQPGDLRGAEYAGCGYFIKGGVYSKFIACASDGNETAYKVKTSEAYTGSNPSQIIVFDSCGLEVCTNAYVIDAPRAAVTINNPSLFNVTANKLAHVENAISLTVNGYSDNIYHKVTTGANVGPGVVRIERGFGTGGNPGYYPLVSVPSVGGFGIDDFSYEGLAPLTTGAAGAGAGVPLAIGRMLTVKNQIEFELYSRGNGAIANAKVEVQLLHNYSGANIDRSGIVYLCASNASNYIETGCISKTNPNISVTETQILDGGGLCIGMRYLIKPFNGLASNATNTVALFRVETVFNPVGSDGQGKNHNIKLAGTYTGRVNCRLKGVDY